MNSLLATTAAITLALIGVGNTHPAATTEPDQQAVTAVRLINTAEANIHREKARYVAFPELASSGALKKAAEMNSAFASVLADLDLQNGVPMRGFDLTIIVSSDGGAYKLSLAAKEDCGVAFFSDQRGIIYNGKAIGCSGS